VRLSEMHSVRLGSSPVPSATTTAAYLQPAMKWNPLDRVCKMMGHGENDLMASCVSKTRGLLPRFRRICGRSPDASRRPPSVESLVADDEWPAPRIFISWASPKADGAAVR